MVSKFGNPRIKNSLTAFNSNLIHAEYWNAYDGVQSSQYKISVISKNIHTYFWVK